MKVPLTDINRDLRRQAKSNIQHYIDEYLPVEYQYYLDSLNMIVKGWSWSLQTHDNRELMQSRPLIKDCYAMQIELLCNATR